MSSSPIYTVTTKYVSNVTGYWEYIKANKVENGQQLLRYWSSFPFLTSTNRSRSWSVGFVSIIVDILSFTTPERRGKEKEEDWERKKKKEKTKRFDSNRYFPEFSSRFTTKELVYYFDYFLFHCSFNVFSYGIEKVSLYIMAQF